ncbi:hypothetical protein [Bacteroides togonis]|uniref:hypothetical protein n=1 Tax=Bacteroides togonis TaxID=1917883 RepID=UPI00094B73C3|nr:hypothetical protein [Bacteroides togonis]
MEIKVKTLKKYIIIASALLIISIISYNIYDKKRTEEMREMEMKKDLEEAIDREYKSLHSEYNSIIETIRNSNYSGNFRHRYLYKLNKILEYPNRYTKYGSTYGDLNDFEEEFEKNKEDDKAILKSIAIRNVYKQIFNNE